MSTCDLHTRWVSEINKLITIMCLKNNKNKRLQFIQKLLSFHFSKPFNRQIDSFIKNPITKKKTRCTHARNKFEIICCNNFRDAHDRPLFVHEFIMPKFHFINVWFYLLYMINMLRCLVMNFIQCRSKVLRGWIDVVMCTYKIVRIAWKVGIKYFRIACARNWEFWNFEHT